MTHESTVLTAAEVGEKLGVSGRTIARRADAGEIKILRKLPGPNGDYLFDSAEIERYIEAAKAAS
jgi:excisionase family DNA binding protein